MVWQNFVGKVVSYFLNKNREGISKKRKKAIPVPEFCYYYFLKIWIQCRMLVELQTDAKGWKWSQNIFFSEILIKSWYWFSLTLSSMWQPWKLNSSASHALHRPWVIWLLTHSKLIFWLTPTAHLPPLSRVQFTGAILKYPCPAKTLPLCMYLLSLCLKVFPSYFT